MTPVLIRIGAYDNIYTLTIYLLGMKKTLIIIAVIVIPLMLGIVFYYSDIRSKLLSENKHRVLPFGSSYSSDKYGFKITPPDGWLIDEQHKGDGTVVSFFDRSKNILAIIRVNVKD